MKFSVIIPAHDEEQYIGKALETIMEQDRDDFEVIVVDNNSTDKTYDVANEFASGLEISGKLRVPITVMRESQRGTMAACERGRSVARGDIIARLDADCRPDAEWLSKAMALFADDKVVAVSGPYAFYDSSKYFNASKIWQQKYILATLNVVLQWFHVSAITNGGNSMFRAAILQKIGGFDTSISFYGDDTNIARRMAREGKVIFDRDLIMQTSARRFQGGGRIRTQAMYIYHFLKQSFNRDHHEIHHQ